MRKRIFVGLDLKWLGGYMAAEHARLSVEYM